MFLMRARVIPHHLLRTSHPRVRLVDYLRMTPNAGLVHVCRFPSPKRMLTGHRRITHQRARSKIDPSGTNFIFTKLRYNQASVLTRYITAAPYTPTDTFVR